MDTTQPLEDTSGIIRAYALLLIGAAFSLVPVWMISGLGLLMALYGIIYVYGLRKPARDTVVCASHVRWIIRTFWMSSAYTLIGMIVYASVISANADTTATQSIAEAISKGSATPDQMTAMTEQFHADNRTLLLWTGLLTMGPNVLFFVIRLIKGYRLAEKYLPLTNVKTWLV